MTSFLTTLPAILGIVGFVIYLIVRKSVTEDPIVKSIIDKLKYDQPDFAGKWEHLTDKQKASLLRDENQLKDKITNKDREILSTALGNQFKTNIFVYTLCGVLVIIGLYMFAVVGVLHQPLRRCEYKQAID